MFLKTSFFQDQGTFKRASNGNHDRDSLLWHMLHFLSACGTLFQRPFLIGSLWFAVQNFNKGRYIHLGSNKR